MVARASRTIGITMARFIRRNKRGRSVTRCVSPTNPGRRSGQPGAVRGESGGRYGRPHHLVERLERQLLGSVSDREQSEPERAGVPGLSVSHGGVGPDGVREYRVCLYPMDELDRRTVRRVAGGLSVSHGRIGQDGVRRVAGGPMGRVAQEDCEESVL